MLTGVRVAWGTVLLVAPRRLLGLVSSRPPSLASRLVAGLLGVRELVQAAILAPRPSRTMLAGGAAVDSLHSATMVWLASRRPEYRRAAIVSALLAALFAVAEGWRASGERQDDR